MKVASWRMRESFFFNAFERSSAASMQTSDGQGGILQPVAIQKAGGREESRGIIHPMRLRGGIIDHQPP